MLLPKNFFQTCIPILKIKNNLIFMSQPHVFCFKVKFIIILKCIEIKTILH